MGEEYGPEMTVVVNGRSDFTLENFRRVAVGGEGVAIGDEARKAMETARIAFVALLESDRTAFMYGVTSRPGIEVQVAVAPEEQPSGFAWADLALVAERHVTCLHSAAVSELPNLLAVPGARAWYAG
jgi:histidine ammonia-lyase